MNRLADSASPYLLQHKDNPVHWWPWSPEALAEAQKTGKPILLSIGYAACHWCHVMAHESFESDAIADVMNEHFINIKVDREERPDIDQIYMSALHMMGQQGGWPLTMFLDSDARPFWGGTYFPPEPRYGRPGFPEILTQIAELYASNDERIEKNRSALFSRLQADAAPRAAALPAPLSSQLAARLLAASDPVNGGIGQAPKFPNAAIIDFLWRHARAGNEAARDHVIHTFRRICQGGIYDHVGGGFARYAVDARWLVPHFEKMLYDNALLLPLLAYAWSESGDDLFRARIEETIRWLDREMLLPSGAYAASLDADSEGVEGKFYVWTSDEVSTVLGENADAFCATYDITNEGNWEGVSIPNRLHVMQPELAKRDFQAELDTLRLAREKRIRPGRDDKVLTDWNALAVSGLARAGQILQRAEWVERARSVHDAISTDDPDNLPHASREDRRVMPALASDHANLARAAIALQQATGDDAYLDRARAHMAALDDHYVSESAPAYHMAHRNAGDVIVRTLSGHDDAVPNPNAVAAETCALLATITGEETWRSKALQIVENFGAAALENPAAHVGLFAALDAAEAPVHVLIAGDDAKAVDSLAAELAALPEPNLVIERSDKRDGDQPAHAVVCVGTQCSLPIADPQDIVSELVKLRADSQVESPILPD